MSERAVDAKLKDKIKKWQLKKLSLMILFYKMNVFTKDQWCGSSQTNIWLSPCSDSGISSYLSKVSARRNLLLLILGAKHPLQIAFSVFKYYFRRTSFCPSVHPYPSSEPFFESALNKQIFGDCVHLQWYRKYELLATIKWSREEGWDQLYKCSRI